MPTDHGFEQLDVWQLARTFCRDLVPVVAKAKDCRDYELSQQLNAASLSIMSNIAEGYLRRSRREFAYFLRVAAGSNGEARTCLYVAADRGYVGAVLAEGLIETSNRIGQMISGLLRRLA